MARPPWLAASRCSAFGLAAAIAIGAYAVRLLGFEGKAELLANDARKEAADRMLLPARGLHDGGDRHPLGSSQETEDLLLLRAGSGLRLKLCFLSGSFPRSALCCARQFRFGIAGFLGHLGLLFRLRRRRAPSPPKPRSGAAAGGAGSWQGSNARCRASAVTLHSQVKSSPLFSPEWVV